jgi:hypothetical protein
MTITASGCFTESRKKLSTVTLDISAKVNGKPLVEGSVLITPVSESAGSPVSGNLQNGRVRLSEVPIGRVLVVVTSLKDTGRTKLLYGKETPVVENQIPSNKRDGILKDVRQTDTELNLDF